MVVSGLEACLAEFRFSKCLGKWFGAESTDEHGESLTGQCLLARGRQLTASRWWAMVWVFQIAGYHTVVQSIPTDITTAVYSSTSMMATPPAAAHAFNIRGNKKILWLTSQEPNDEC
jgi:hypothetical protein